MPATRSSETPLIGITGRRFLASSLNSDPSREMIFAGLRIDGFYSAYAEKLAAAGATPVYLAREAEPADLLARLDGLILAGGLDVDPRLYGGMATAHSTLLDPEQDEFEIELTRLALERGVPLLGTCRGHELLNVALGGTLRAHLDDLSGPHHNRGRYPLADRGHAIRVNPGSTLHGLYGSTPDVNSFHHQAIDRLGAGVEAVAFCEHDEVVEAIEVGGAEAVGVQWHPEFAPGLEPVLAWIVERAAARAAVGPSVDFVDHGATKSTPEGGAAR